jgi:hypothetical protein
VYISSSSEEAAIPLTVGKWAYFIFSGTAPATAAKCKIRLWNACTTAITRYADDVKLVAVAGEVSRLTAGIVGAISTSLASIGELGVTDLEVLTSALFDGTADFDGRATIGNFLNLDMGAELTISGGAITPTRTFHTVEVESDTTDNLDEITIDNISEGDLILLRPATTNDIVVRHLGGGGNIRNFHNVDVTLKGIQNHWMGIRRGSYIEEIGGLFNIGTHVQAQNAYLDQLSLCVPAGGTFIVGTAAGPAWVIKTPSEVREVLGLEIGADVQAWDADLDKLASCTPTANGDFIVGDGFPAAGPGWYKKTAAQTRGFLRLGAVLAANAEGDTIAAASTEYLPLSGVAPSGAIANRGFIVPFAGTAQNLYIRTNTSQPVGGTLVFTVLLNTVATAVTITVAAGGAAAVYSDTTHSFTFSAGGRLCLRAVNNAGSVVSAAVNSISLELLKGV